MSKITIDLLQRLHKQAPRYTSYPTAPAWKPLTFQEYLPKLQECGHNDQPLSLYVHIPFCKTMCLFCACSVLLNRKPEVEERYVHYLCKELDLLSSHLKSRKKLLQLHLGGGTPTKLSIPLLKRLFEKIHETFSLEECKEIAIEIDPRTVVEDKGEKLHFLREQGFNRISFGVQDTDAQVQEAIKRRQSYAMTLETYQRAKELQFEGINIDLIYGLPFQTQATFAKTIEDILHLRPDRIALFSYAKVPWLKPHQNAIADETLPSTEEKFGIYVMARETFMQNGYIAIGMDHFALKDDEMALSYEKKQLQRNFQGYSVKHTQNLLGVGVSSIGLVEDGYFQNEKELERYYAALDQGTLPVCRGILLGAEDKIRKWVIHTLMCSFEINKNTFQQLFSQSFDRYFESAREGLNECIREGLIEETEEKILATSTGELFIRNVAMVFDAYLKPSETPQFSKSV